MGLIIPANVMADSVYISSNITSDQLRFMKLLDDFEVDIFNFNEIETLLNQSFDNLNEILENLVDKQLLSRIERGKFCRSNFRDENVIGTFIVRDSAIAYWSGQLTQGTYTQSSLAVMAADLDLNKQNINLTGLMVNGMEYVPL